MMEGQNRTRGKESTGWTIAKSKETVINPINDEVEPEGVNSSVDHQAKKDGIDGNSQDFNSGNDEPPRAATSPKTNNEVHFISMKHKKRFYGLYIISAVLALNSAYIIFGISTSNSDLNTVLKVVGAVLALGSIGLIRRNYFARVLVIGLCILLSIISLFSLETIIYVITLGYLYMPHVREEFNS